MKGENIRKPLGCVRMIRDVIEGSPHPNSFLAVTRN